MLMLRKPVVESILNLSDWSFVRWLTHVWQQRHFLFLLISTRFRLTRIHPFDQNKRRTKFNIILVIDTHQSTSRKKRNRMNFDGLTHCHHHHRWKKIVYTKPHSLLFFPGSNPASRWEKTHWKQPNNSRLGTKFDYISRLSSNGSIYSFWG